MNKYILKLALMLMITAFTNNGLAEAKKEINWVGCGISKKAYMVDLATEYEKLNGIKINLQGGGATKGIRDVAAMNADFGGSCRFHFKDHPEEKSVGLEPVAWDALVVIVHKNNPVSNITYKQMSDVLDGKIKNWNELGGNDAPIQLFARKSKSSGVGLTLRKLVFADYEKEFKAHKFFKSSGPLEKELVESENAIAVTGISSARLRDLKILTLDDAAPSYDNIRSGKYTLYRPLYITYNPESINNVIVKDFIRFAHSNRGRSIMKRNGVVPYLEALYLVMKQVEQDKRAYRNGIGELAQNM